MLVRNRITKNLWFGLTGGFASVWTTSRTIRVLFFLFFILFLGPRGPEGNCLFNALSDQLFGDQSHHIELRGATVDYIRSDPDHFKKFITVFPGGGTRRNPKRKNPGSLSNRLDLAGPTATEIEASFQRQLKTMAQGGT